MSKLIAVLNVVAWAGFWAFGYLALTAGGDQSGHVLVSMILAALGGALGIFAYLWLVRHSEQIGYARRPNVLDPETREAAQARHGTEIEA